MRELLTVIDYHYCPVKRRRKIVKLAPPPPLRGRIEVGGVFKKVYSSVYDSPHPDLPPQGGKGKKTH